MAAAIAGNRGGAMSATGEVPDQRTRALTRANQIQRERIALLGGGYKQKIPADRMAELVVAVPEALASMQMRALLRYTQGYKSPRVSKLLDSELISETRLLRELTERQRLALAGRLRP